MRVKGQQRQWGTCQKVEAERALENNIFKQKKKKTADITSYDKRKKEFKKKTQPNNSNKDTEQTRQPA